jgi:hypothetical protein
MDPALQARELAERLRAARKKANAAASHMSSEQIMEQMFRNGSDRKPNPFLNGELQLVGLSPGYSKSAVRSSCPTKPSPR